MSVGVELTALPLYHFVLPRATKVSSSVNSIFLNGSDILSSAAIEISSHFVSAVTATLSVLYNLPLSVPTTIYLSLAPTPTIFSPSATVIFEIFFESVTAYNFSEPSTIKYWSAFSEYIAS